MPETNWDDVQNIDVTGVGVNPDIELPPVVVVAKPEPRPPTDSGGGSGGGGYSGGIAPPVDQGSSGMGSDFRGAGDVGYNPATAWGARQPGGYGSGGGGSGYSAYDPSGSYSTTPGGDSSSVPVLVDSSGNPIYQDPYSSSTGLGAGYQTPYGDSVGVDSIGSNPNREDAEFIAEDAQRLREAGYSEEAIRQVLGSYASSDAIDSALGALNSGGSQQDVANELTNLAENSGLMIQDYNDLQFAIMDAQSLWDNTRDAAAVQQNLIASGLDPIDAADITNRVAMGQPATTIYDEIATANDASGSRFTYGPAFNPKDKPFWSGEKASPPKLPEQKTTEKKPVEKKSESKKSSNPLDFGPLLAQTTQSTKPDISAFTPRGSSSVNPIGSSSGLGALGKLKIDPYERKFAEGGLVSMDAKPYRKGGLSSISDGVSDSVKARLSVGEYVIPSRVVSEIGNGSTDAGSKRLDDLINRVDKRRKNIQSISSRNDDYLKGI